MRKLLLLMAIILMFVGCTKDEVSKPDEDLVEVKVEEETQTEEPVQDAEKEDEASVEVTESEETEAITEEVIEPSPEGIKISDDAFGEQVLPESFDISMFVDQGWTVIRGSIGLFNEDDFEDIVLIIQKEPTDDEDVRLMPRKMMIIESNDTGDYLTDSDYVTTNTDLMLTASDGGVFGDPLEYVSIEDKQLKIRYYGGSNFRWYYEMAFNSYYRLVDYLEGAYHTVDLSDQYSLHLDIDGGLYEEGKADDEGEMQYTQGGLTTAYYEIDGHEPSYNISQLNILEISEQIDSKYILEEPVVYDMSYVVEDMNSLQLDIDDYANPTFVRGAYFYMPLTYETLKETGLSFDSIYRDGELHLPLFDRVVGDDGYTDDDDFVDSHITIDQYADAFGCKVPSADELEACLFNSSLWFDATLFFDRPGIYIATSSVTTAEGGLDGGSPIFLLLDQYHFHNFISDFDILDAAVVLMKGDMLDVNYPGVYLREVVTNEEGESTITFFDEQLDEVRTFQVTDETKIYNSDGELVSFDEVGVFQMPFDINIIEDLIVDTIFIRDFHM